jgi:hypothetical protein
MKIIDAIGEVIERVVMLCFVLTLLSGVIAINYLMWKTLMTSDLAQLDSIQVELNEQNNRIAELERKN